MNLRPLAMLAAGTAVERLTPCLALPGSETRVSVRPDAQKLRDMAKRGDAETPENTGDFDENRGELLEPVAGFGPATPGLQNRCSTLELHRRSLLYVLTSLADLPQSVQILPPAPPRCQGGRGDKLAPLATS